MAEEESFVILGSCSQPNSLNLIRDVNNEQLQQQNGGISTPTNTQQPILNEQKFSSITKAIASATKPLESSTNPGQSGVDIWKKSTDSNTMDASIESYRSVGRDVWGKSVISNNTTEAQKENSIAEEVMEGKEARSTGAIPKTSAKETTSEIDTKEPKEKSAENSLAVSFIMGQVPADALKASIHSQFPSVSLQDCEELTTVMGDYIKMKDLIMQVNSKMSTWLEKKNMMHSLEMENRQKLEQCQEQIAALRNENLNLKRELNEKVEQLTAFDTVRKIEQGDMVKIISEKSALIENMRAQIEKLEVQQLASFEVISKGGKDEKDSAKSEYVTRLEHERIVKGFERNMSQLLAEKLEISDMQKQYIDEINCLKTNLAASEELVKQLQSDIALLKSSDAEKTAQFVLHATQRDQMREEIEILRQQVDVYSRDFQLERTAREEMAGEKAQLLDDLRALQRINQKLTEQVANHEERLASISSSTQRHSPPAGARSTSATPITTPPASAHLCPICSTTCSSLTTLQEHVNQCLDRNVHT